MDTRTWMRYWRRALFAARLLSMVPYIRMVGLNGSMVTGTFHRGSDIDFYIVTKDRHIFLARLLSAFVLRVFGLRRDGVQIAGKVCENRYAVESFVDITPHDRYHAEVFHNLVPLFVDGPAYIHFLEENQWMRRLGHEPIEHQPVLQHNAITFLLQKLFEVLVWSQWLEHRAEAWQRSRVETDWRAGLPGSKVSVSNRELRFHLAKEQNGKA